MTNEARKKKCDHCKKTFHEKSNDSSDQWKKKRFCSNVCANRGRPKKPIFERLEGFVVKTDGCWKWTGTRDAFGYGKLSGRDGRKSSPERAHRVAYEKYIGAIPEGLFVCHRCDNPECTNPEHLFLGTAKENSIDCSKKGRLNKKSLLNLKPSAKGFLGAGPKSNKELEKC